MPRRISYDRLHDREVDLEQSTLYIDCKLARVPPPPGSNDTWPDVVQIAFAMNDEAMECFTLDTLQTCDKESLELHGISRKIRRKGESAVRILRTLIYRASSANVVVAYDTSIVIPAILHQCDRLKIDCMALTYHPSVFCLKQFALAHFNATNPPILIDVLDWLDLNINDEVLHDAFEDANAVRSVSKSFRRLLREKRTIAPAASKKKTRRRPAMLPVWKRTMTRVRAPLPIIEPESAPVEREPARTPTPVEVAAKYGTVYKSWGIPIHHTCFDKTDGSVLYVDCETTGLPPQDENDDTPWPDIVQLAHATDDGPMICHVLNTKRPSHPKAFAVHKITDEQRYRHGYNAKSVMEKFMRAVKRADIITAYNTAFDIPVIAVQCRRLGIDWTPLVEHPRIYCAMRGSGLGFVKLTAAAKHYKIEIDPTTLHDAAGDTVILRKVFDAQRYEQKRYFWECDHCSHCGRRTEAWPCNC